MLETEPTQKETKIAIFENQITQFRCLASFLRNKEFAIWPDPDSPNDDCFRQLMNAVHVFLNKQYMSDSAEESEIDSDEDYWAKCRDYFCESLKAWKPDLIIIDHKLSPPINSLDGFDLADFLLDQDIKSPILFLSRSDPSSQKVIEGLERISKRGIIKWLSKGYQGGEVLEEGYLNSVFLNDVRRLLKVESSNAPQIDNNEDLTTTTIWPDNLELKLNLS